MEKFISQSVAKNIAKHGFCVLPAKADAKIPAVKTWKEFQTRKPSAEEIQRFFPAARLCVICGKVSGFLEVLDFDQKGVCFPAFMERIPADLETRLVYEQTPSGGFHVFYRCQGGVEKNLELARDPKGAILIETRGEGGLVLCSPSPKYVFQQGSYKDVPSLTASERQTLIDTAKSFNQYATSQKSRPVRVQTPPMPRSACSMPVDDYNARGDVRGLLERFGWTYWTSKGDTEEWTRPGKTQGCSATLKPMEDNFIFYVFSSNAAPFTSRRGYSPFQVYALLEHGGDLTAATSALFDAGYGQQEQPFSFKKLAENVVARQAAPPNIPDDEAFLPSATQSSSVFPPELLEVPGFMGEVVRYLLSSAVVKQPEYALATAIVTQSILCNQSYRTSQDTRANVYCLVSGSSGSGKEWGRSFIKEVFTYLSESSEEMSPYWVNVLAQRFSSFPAIQNDLREFAFSPRLLLWDEMGASLRSMASPCASGPFQEIIPGIMEIYTSSHTDFFPARKAEILDKAKRNLYTKIQQPFLSILGTATPEQLLGAMTPRLVEEGFLGRTMLFCEAPVRDRDETAFDITTIHRVELTDSMMVWLSEWGRRIPVEIPRPDVVDATPEANVIFNALGMRQVHHVKEGGWPGALWSRAVEQALKLALLYAVSETPETPKISVEAALWACNLSDFLTTRKIHIATRWIGDNPFDNQCNEVIRWLEDNGGKGAKSTFCTRFRKWPRKDREAIIDNLLNARIIQTDKVKSSGRTAEIFVLSAYKEGYKEGVQRSR